MKMPNPNPVVRWMKLAPTVRRNILTILSIYLNLACKDKIKLPIFVRLKCMKILLTILGLISLGLGILGIFLPVLPTTPLLLLAAALFLRSHKGLYDWLLNHPRLGPYIRNFMVHKSIPLKIKVLSVSMVWITLLYCAIFVAGHWALRLFFILLAAGISIHILSYKTLK
jgi:uncharacterized membrane protein YbaN (DUF454 family)